MAKHVVKSVVSEPAEIVKEAVGTAAKPNENQAMEAIEQGAQGQPSQASDDSNNPKGFKTVQDFQKYQNLSGKKDEMELAILRKSLHREFGLTTDLETGMQKARMEYQQKEEERKQVEEQKKEEKKQIEFMQKKQEEDMAVKAAREASSAENKAWGAG